MNTRTLVLILLAMNLKEPTTGGIGGNEKNPSAGSAGALDLSLAIRSALGASLRHLVTRASRDGLSAVAVGVAFGLVGAYWGSILLAQFLFQVSARSLGSYGGVAAVVILAAGIAAWLSARRLAQIPLAATLRTD